MEDNEREWLLSTTDTWEEYMAENMMNSEHKAATKKSREGWDRIFGHPCPSCGSFDYTRTGICLECGATVLPNEDDPREER